MEQINHSLTKRERWQRKHRNRQRLYEDRSNTKHLIEYGNGNELKWVMSLISERMKPWNFRCGAIPMENKKKPSKKAVKE